MFFHFFDRLCGNEVPGAVRLVVIVEVPISVGGKPCVCTDNESGHVKLFHQLFFQRDQGFLLIFISGMDAEGQRDPVPVHEQAHPDNGKWSVLFAQAVLFIIFRLFNLKIEVRTVVINDFRPTSGNL